MTRITCEGAWIEFPIKPVASKDGTIADIGGTIDPNRGIVSALQDITLDLKEGDRLGIIGHNGAGKSTMLRLLAGVYSPTQGRVSAVGRISTLFNSTPGLNMDGSGRENIVICGLHLGLNRREIAAKSDEIIAFAELGPYIDLPVRTYSSGMLMRLGFSIATAVEPEILLLDEGLATGDAGFTQKAQSRMNEMIDRSSILVVASHSESFVQKVCNRCIVLEHGRILADGAPDQLVQNYRSQIIEGAKRGAPDALRKAYIMAVDMASRGELPPPALEEQGLRYALTIAPNSIKMWRRYVALLQEQNKPISFEVKIRSLIAEYEEGTDMEANREALQRGIESRDGETLDEELAKKVDNILSKESIAS
ncbi:ABC transporter ATP-binding protein [Marivibrio halodurans]|uniref:ABC transporter ATP-binding protein n=1 Tax=Marivibrio halodurans TaxID=2039722 RepID=A0A8J7V108_9PROT|nr:ABC transporter ATP-binding protein [Marivibrio halodurans]MBP5855611.1 ABC transporter ATP-binding protein [Marivibrio halodurans]